MSGLTTPEGVTEHMRAATSATDWEARACNVQNANDGYPEFWWATIILSGVLGNTERSWQA